MIRKLLCWLGFHDYKLIRRCDSPHYGFGGYITHVCTCCKDIFKYKYKYK